MRHGLLSPLLAISRSADLGEFLLLRDEQRKQEHPLSALDRRGEPFRPTLHGTLCEACLTRWEAGTGR